MEFVLWWPTEGKINVLTTKQRKEKVFTFKTRGFLIVATTSLFYLKGEPHRLPLLEDRCTRPRETRVVQRSTRLLMSVSKSTTTVGWPFLRIRSLPFEDSWCFYRPDPGYGGLPNYVVIRFRLYLTRLKVSINCSCKYMYTYLSFDEEILWKHSFI